MDDQQIRRLLERMHKLLAEAREIQQILRQLGVGESILNEQFIAEVVQRLQQQRVELALARINFYDDHYVFIRAIDGDTIVVKPPETLREWMNDVHIRLYGLETPELWHELGQQYRQHLEDLCAIDADRKLMIVWERERGETAYAGFPRTSFERGIGHVFFKNTLGKYVYVNGLMHVLPHCTLLRDGRNLLRGARLLESTEVRVTWDGPCPSGGTVDDNASPTMRQILKTSPPACLLSFDTIPTFDPRENTKRDEPWPRRGDICPLMSEVARCNHTLADAIATQRASLFDIPLTMLSQWTKLQNTRMT